MGRPRKPTAILDLTGALKKNPQRKRPDEPQPVAEIGAAPAILADDEREVWDELVANAAPGVLTCQDRQIVEIASREMVKYRAGGNPTNLMKALAKMGFSPADRSTVAVKKK